MNKNKFKKLFSGILAVSLAAISLFATLPQIHAAPGDKDTINMYRYFSISGQDNTIYTNGPWYKDNGVTYNPTWAYKSPIAEVLNYNYFRTVEGNVAYCLDNGKKNPSGEVTGEAEQLSNKLQRVIVSGYPYKSGSDYGIADHELEWATSVALYIIEGTRYDKVTGEPITGALSTNSFVDGTLHVTYSEDFYSRSQLLNDALNSRFMTMEEAQAVNPNGGNETSGANWDKYQTYLANKLADANKIKDVVSTLVAKADDTSIALNLFTVEKTNMTTVENNGVVTYGPFDITTNISGDITLALTNAPAGAQIVDASGNPLASINKTGTAQETFKVYVKADKTAMTSNFSPVVTASMNNKIAYTTVAYKPTSSLEQKMYIAKSQDIVGSITFDITKINPLLSKIKLVKSTTDNKPLNNISFEIFAKTEIKDFDGNVVFAPGALVQTVKTANGEITSNELYPGTYTVHEIPVTGLLPIVDIDVEVLPNTSFDTIQIISREIKNTVQLGKVTVTKLDDNSEVIKGTVFNVIAKEDIKDFATGAIIYNKDQIIQSITTDVNGLASSKLLPLGKYALKETFNDGYVLIKDEIPFELVYDNSVVEVVLEKTISNTKNTFSITKTNSDGTKFLENAEIEVYFVSNVSGSEALTLINRYRTDADGKITLTKLSTGKYAFKETIAPDGYVLNKTVYYFEVLADGTVIGTSTLKNNETSFVLLKIDSETKLAVPGAEFEIKDSAGTVIHKGKTDAQGKITLKGLVAGTKYTYQEITAPNGYVLNNAIVEFTFTNEAEMVITVENTPSKKAVIITKKDLTNGDAVPGATIEITDSTGKVVATEVTDKYGKTPEFKLEPGKYTFKETIAPNGYILSTDTFSFEIAADGTVTGTTTITNKPNEIKLSKTNEQGKGLQGATLVVMDSNRKVYATEVTDSSGYIYLRKIPAGKYYVKETNPPAGYALTDEQIEFTIDNYGNITGKTSIVNKVTSITITKKDLTSGVVLEGAEIEIKNVAGKVVAKGTTGKNGQTSFAGLAAGDYTFYEVKAPNGYELNKESYKFTINTDGTVKGDLVLYNKKAPAGSSSSSTSNSNSSSSKPEVVQTGEMSSTSVMPFFFILMAVMLATSGAFVFIKRKRK